MKRAIFMATTSLYAVGCSFTKPGSGAAVRCLDLSAMTDISMQKICPQLLDPQAALAMQFVDPGVVEVYTVLCGRARLLQTITPYLNGLSSTSESVRSVATEKLLALCRDDRRVGELYNLLTYAPTESTSDSDCSAASTIVEQLGEQCERENIEKVVAGAEREFIEATRQAK